MKNVIAALLGFVLVVGMKPVSAEEDSQNPKQQLESELKEELVRIIEGPIGETPDPDQLLNDPHQAFRHFLLQYMSSEIVDPRHPMLREMRSNLSQELFKTTDKKQFVDRVELLNRAIRLRTEYQPAFRAEAAVLDSELQIEWQGLEKKTKSTRIVTLVSGVALGLIAVAVTKYYPGYGVKWLTLTVPVAVLAGGSLGYLFGKLLFNRGYRFNKLDWSTSHVSEQAQNLLDRLQDLQREPD